MQAAVAHPGEFPSHAEAVGWQKNIAAIAAILLGIVFLVSGGWKVLSPFKTGELLEQAKVHSGWGSIGAATLGTLELFTAFLLFVPRFRRWGGLLGSGLMIFFIGWVGYYYSSLVGQECSCFPIIKRTIGPGFFIGDGIMLLLGVLAFLWSTRLSSLKIPAAVLVAFAALAGVSYGYSAWQRSHIQVPVPLIVDGKPQDLSTGKVFLFFYDPSCMHCDAASKFMSTLNWGDTRVVAIPTVNPQWAASFLRDTHLKAGTSLELEKLRKQFQFVDPPYGVILIDGQVKQSFAQAQFNVPLPGPDLKKWGLVR
jgi:hypothetical protein